MSLTSTSSVTMDPYLQNENKIKRHNLSKAGRLVPGKNRCSIETNNLSQNKLTLLAIC